MTDRTTKALLLAIAIGLWMNVAGQWWPTALQAQDDYVRQSRNFLSTIDTAIGRLDSTVEGIADGTCKNRKVC